MSSRLQLDVRNLSLGRRHLVNAYEVGKNLLLNSISVTTCHLVQVTVRVRYELLTVRRRLPF